VVVEGVANTEGALGYFGFTYYEENADKLKALEIDSGSGCVAPSVETAQAGEYTPLARPLFIYVSNQAYTQKPAVQEYVDFYVENLTDIAEAAEYIPLNEEQAAETKSTLEGIG
jgi:phosphate transport system substrate-binding protein